MEACTYGARAACASQTQTEPTPLRSRRSAHGPHGAHGSGQALPPHAYIERISCPVRRRFYEDMATSQPVADTRCLCRNADQELKEKDGPKRRLLNKPVQSRSPCGQLTWRVKRTVVESIREWERHSREARRQNNYVPTVVRRKTRVVEPQRRTFMQHSASVPHNKTFVQPKRQQRVCEFHRQQCPVHGAHGHVGGGQSRRVRSESEPSLHSQGVQALLKQPRKSVSCSKKCISTRLFPAQVPSRLTSQETSYASPPARRVTKSMPKNVKSKPSQIKEERVVHPRPYLKEILKDPALSPQNYYSNQNVYKNNMFNNKQINTNENDLRYQENQARTPKLRPPYFNEKFCYNCNCYRTNDRKMNLNKPLSSNRFSKYANVRHVESQMSRGSLRRHNVSSQVSIPFDASSVPIVLIKSPSHTSNKLLTKSGVMHVDIKPKECCVKKPQRSDANTRVIELPRRQSTLAFLAPILKKLTTLVPGLAENNHQTNSVPKFSNTRFPVCCPDAETANPAFDIALPDCCETQTTEMHTCTDLPSETDLIAKPEPYDVPDTENASVNTRPETPDKPNTEKTIHDTQTTAVDLLNLLAKNASMPNSTNEFKVVSSDIQKSLSQPMKTVPHLSYKETGASIGNRSNEESQQTLIPLATSLTNKEQANRSAAISRVDVVNKSDAIVDKVVTKSESNQTPSRIEQLSQPLERKMTKTDRSRPKRLLTIAQRNKMYKNRRSLSLNSSPECGQRQQRSEHSEYLTAPPDCTYKKANDRCLAKSDTYF